MARDLAHDVWWPKKGQHGAAAGMLPRIQMPCGRARAHCKGHGRWRGGTYNLCEPGCIATPHCCDNYKSTEWPTAASYLYVFKCTHLLETRTRGLACSSQINDKSNRCIVRPSRRAGLSQLCPQAAACSLQLTASTVAALKDKAGARERVWCGACPPSLYCIQVSSRCCY